MSLLDACTAVLAAGGTVSFPYRPRPEDWLQEVKAYRLGDAFAVYDPYEGHEHFASAERAAWRLLQLAQSGKVTV